MKLLAITVVACVLFVALGACVGRRTAADATNADGNFATFLSKYDEAIGEFAKEDLQKSKAYGLIGPT
jgi:hypothetical protein